MAKNVRSKIYLVKCAECFRSIFTQIIVYVLDKFYIGPTNVRFVEPTRLQYARSKYNVKYEREIRKRKKVRIVLYK